MKTRHYTLAAIFILVMSLSGCGGGGSGADTTASMSTSGTGTVGIQGGTVSVDDGAATVMFPANAYTADTTVTVAASTTAPTSPRLVSGTAYEFGPPGAFAQNANLTIKYNPSSIPAGALESRLVMYTAVAGIWQPVPGSSVNTSLHTVSAPTSHFSTYAILADNQFAGQYSGTFTGFPPNAGTWSATVDTSGNVAATATGGFIGAGSVSYNGTSTIPLAGSGTSQGFTITFGGTFVLHADGTSVNASGTWGSTSGETGSWSGRKN